MYVSACGLGFSETIVIEPQGARRLTRTARALLRSEGEPIRPGLSAGSDMS